MKTKIVRAILTAVLIVAVWFNSHWTVVLAIVIIRISQELLSYDLKKERAHRIERQKIEYRLFRKLKKVKQELEKQKEQTK